MKAFISGDFETKYERTTFKKIDGRDPEALFYSESGRLVERLGLEDLTRYFELDFFDKIFLDAKAFLHLIMSVSSVLLTSSI